MPPLSTLVEKEIFEDAPYFSDQLLLPAIASGHRVTLVSAFAPSYLFRLVNDLASSPEIEPGHLQIVFCIPFQQGSELSRARLLSKYLSAFAGASSEVKIFLESLLQLVDEGGLSLNSLFSNETRLLTPGCIGVIESTELGSSEYISFIDRTAGDLNSPIPIGTSWGAETSDHQEIVRNVSRALGENFSNLLRLNHGEVVDLCREILQRGYPRIDLGERDKIVKSDKRKRSSAPGKTKSTKRSLSDEDDDFDELDLDGDDFDVDEYNDIDAIIAEMNLSETDLYYLSVYSFLGYDDVLIDSPSPRIAKSHAPPLTGAVAEAVGNVFGICWCGEEYDRSHGCPSYSD